MTSSLTSAPSHSSFVKPSTMRAARCHERGQGPRLTVDNVDVPEIGDQEVLVKIEACGMVPNLINVLNPPPHFQNLPILPAIYGLDPAGVIVETGAKVRGLSLGDRVYVNPLRSCSGCRACRRGLPQACQYAALNGYMGIGPSSGLTFEDHRYGGFAEYMPAAQDGVVVLPDNVSFEAAARWGYLGTAYGALRRGGVGVGSTVLINGISGTLGIGAAMFAVALGATKVFGVGRNQARLDRVKAIAPDRIEVLSVGGEGSPSVEEWVRSCTDGIGAEVVIDSLPAHSAPEHFTAAAAALARGGTHVNAGGVFDSVPLSVIDMMNNHQSYVGSLWFSTAQGQEMADLAGSSIVDLGVLEHHVYALDDINDALADVQGHLGGFANFVIKPAV